MVDRTGRNTRQNVVYQITDEVKNSHHPPKYASVIPSETNTVRLHSTAERPAPAQRPLLLREVLNLRQNKALWRHFTCTGDGSWIREGLPCGSLLLVHDGSYMKKVDPNICSAAYVIRCRTTGNKARGLIVEKADLLTTIELSLSLIHI